MNSKNVRVSVKGFFVMGVVLAVLAPGCKGAETWSCECLGDTTTFSTTLCSAGDPVVTAEAQCTKAGYSNEVCGDCSCNDENSDSCTATQ